MKTRRHLGIILLVTLMSVNGTAQIDSTQQQDKTEFKFGLYYNTGLNYYGRTDSLRSSGFFPLAELWFNKSFYINAAPVFVINSATTFDYAGTVATAGYRFSSENKFAGNIYFVKPFYKSNSQLPQSALKAQAAASFTWLNKGLNLTGGGDVKFSDNIDFGVTAGADHIFRMEPGQGSVLVIDPTAYLNAGTQQFTKTYYKQSSYLYFPGIEQAVTEKSSNFNILSYEFSIPMIYAVGKFQGIFIPAYVIPQNLVTIPGRPDLSERGRNMFYATIGVKVIL